MFLKYSEGFQGPLELQPKSDDMQTEQTLFELFDKIWTVDGESEVWNQANIDQKHVYCSKVPE